MTSYGAYGGGGSHDPLGGGSNAPAPPVVPAPAQRSPVPPSLLAPASAPPTAPLPLGPPPGPPPRRRPAWPGVVALVLAALLIPALALQTWQVYRLDGRLADLGDELSQQQANDQERIDALEGRAGELEQLAGEAFNPETIAEAVLPSVFGVRAGNAGGTAFAVGSETADGGTNLFTNYHVVEELWLAGGREVRLERTNQRYDATIVDVDPNEDVAWLQTDSQFAGLAVAEEPARSGQQVVAVGAPLGLTDTVTSGVVSAVDREVRGQYGRWIQFDASINPGNSGGPVINAAQQVVGIATQKGNPENTEGLGFARPIGDACDLFDVC